MQLGVVALWRFFLAKYTNTRRARRAPNKHYEIPFVRRIPCSSNLLRNAVTRSSLVAVPYYLNTQTQEEHGVSPKKHYEIPFLRGYAVLFPLPYSVKARHRLHNVTSDDLHNVTSNITTEIESMYPFTNQLARRLMASKQEHLCPFT